MNKFYTLLLFFILNISVSFSQTNEIRTPFIQNYSSKEFRGSAQNWSIAQDDRQIMYFANGNEGVIEYDWSEWRHIPIPNLSTVRTLTFHNGLIYAGAIGEIGVLKPNRTGNLEFVSLLDKLDVNDRKFADV